MTYIFQQMLCYWMWLKKEEYWKSEDRHVKAEAKAAISKMLTELKQLWPRASGQGWEKPKFHEQLHIPDDIERNGAPKGYKSDCTEHFHIPFFKALANQTQKRREKQDYQLAKRITEKYMIQAAKAIMTKKSTNQCNKKIATGIHPKATTVYLMISPDGSYTLQWKTKQGPDKYEFDSTVLQCIAHYVSEEVTNHESKDVDGRVQVTVFTDYTRNEVLFRAHPNYRNEGSWYDWIMIKWLEPAMKYQSKRLTRDSEWAPVDHGDYGKHKKKYCYAPARVHGFFEVIEEMQSSIYAVVHSCEFEFKKSSVFSTRWKSRTSSNAYESFVIVPVEAIVRQCFVIPKSLSHSSTDYEEIWPIELWADEFFKV